MVSEEEVLEKTLQQLDELFNRFRQRGHANFDQLRSAVEQCGLGGKEKREMDVFSILEQQERLREQLRRIVTGEPLPQWNTKGLEDLHDVASTLEKEVVLPQSEDRYRRMEGDGPPLWIAKQLKKVRRTVYKGSNALANGVRGLVGRQRVDWTAEKHSVRLQAMLLREVMAQQSFWEQVSGLMLRAGTRTIEELEMGLSAAWVKEQKDLAGDEQSGEGAAAEKEQRVHHKLKTPSEMQEEVVELCKRARLHIDETADEFDRQLKAWKEHVQAEVREAIAKTGTVERAGHYYRYSKIEKMEKELRERLVAQYRRWEQAAVSLSDCHEAQALLIRLQPRESEERDKLLNDFNGFYKSRIRSTVSIGKRLKEIRNEVEKSPEDLSEREQEKRLSELKEGWESYVQLHIMEPLDQAEGPDLLSEALRGYTNRILLRVQDWKEQISMPEKLSLVEPWPEVKVVEVAWRRVGLRHFRAQFKQGLGANQFELNKLDQKVRGELEELGEVVEINIASALESLQNHELSPADCRRSILEGLERAESKRKVLHNILKERKEHDEQLITERAEATLDELVAKVLENEMEVLQRKEREYRVKAAAVDWRTRLRARFAQLQDGTLVLVRFVSMKLRKQWKRLKKLLGFEASHKITAQQKADLAEYLTETRRKIADLPFIYRRLFDFETHLDTRFYSSPRSGLPTIQKAYESWQQQYSAAAAVVGEKGAGKSTFVARFQEEHPTARNAHQLRLEHSIFKREQMIDWVCKELKLGSIKDPEVDEIAAKLAARGRQVVVLENIQNAYLRTIGGFEAIEALLELIAATRRQVFWVVTGSRYAWDYLQRVMQFRDYFSHVISVDNLDEQQLRQVILSRHRASGFELIFDADEAEQQQRSYRKRLDKPDEAQQYLRDRFFTKLGELAEGNASIGMLFWLRSIREVGETHLVIAPLEIKSLEMMEELTPEVLFMLAMFVLHDTLTPGELAAAINLPESKAALMVSRFLSRGLLEREGDQYHLNHLIYRQTIRVLKQRNILH